MKNLLGIKDVSRHLGLHPATIRRYIKEGKLKGFRVGPRTFKISPEALEEFKAGKEFVVVYAKLPEKGETKTEESNQLIKK